MYLNKRNVLILFYRFQLHANWNKLHIFVMNLALADLCYCAIPMPFYLSLYFGNEWVFGTSWCKATAIIAHLSGYGSWMALSLIASVRMLGIWTPNFINRICTNRGSKTLIAIQWIFVLLLLIPTYFEVKYLMLWNIITRIRYHLTT